MIKKKILVIVVALLLVAVIGATAAFMFLNAAADNTFQAGVVSCTVHEKLDGGNFTEGEQYGNQKHSIQVENTGNVSAYIRIKVVSYWVDEDGAVVGMPSEQPELTLRSGWLQGEEGTYYYSKAVEPSAFTGILCSQIQLKTKTDANGKTIYQAVDLLAEGIQAQPAQAVEEAWKVTVYKDEIFPEFSSKK